MPEDKPSRHWRVIAQELAEARDPDRIRLLWKEMTRAICFVRYEDSDEIKSIK